jgi:hypothetical protein
MEIKEIEKTFKKGDFFICEICEFKCMQKCDWDRHILRPKHKNGQMEMKKTEKN